MDLDCGTVVYEFRWTDLITRDIATDGLYFAPLNLQGSLTALMHRARYVASTVTSAEEDEATAIFAI